MVGSGGGGDVGASWKGGKNALAVLFLDVRTVTAPAAAPIFNALLLLMPLFFFFASSFGLAMMLSFFSNCMETAVLEAALVYTRYK